MDLHEIYELLKEEGPFIIAITALLMTFIQIAPIKINPWSAIGKWISKIFTGDISKQIEKLDKKIDEVDKKLIKHIDEADQRDLRKRRESILDFASAIAENKRRYTKEQFEQMMSECDMYTKYCEEKNFPNAVAEESIALIRHAYSCKLKDNSFLQTAGLTCEMIKGDN